VSGLLLTLRTGIGQMDTATDFLPEVLRAVRRIESARIIAGLAGLVRDVGLAEELAQDALLAVLEQWPADGIPPNPGAWLMLTAKHHAIDRIRRNERLASKLRLLGRELETGEREGQADFAAGLTEDQQALRLPDIQNES
jgi:predicted RNA polymerase sigma factor